MAIENTIYCDRCGEIGGAIKAHAPGGIPLLRRKMRDDCGWGIRIDDVRGGLQDLCRACLKIVDDRPPAKKIFDDD